jgi:hypothetical protein
LIGFAILVDLLDDNVNPSDWSRSVIDSQIGSKAISTSCCVIKLLRIFLVLLSTVLSRALVATDSFLLARQIGNRWRVGLVGLVHCDGLEDLAIPSRLVATQGQSLVFEILNCHFNL